MRNHDQKIKDISRSVLPSTGRRSARKNRRIFHKQQRARELAAVTVYRRAADPDSVTPDVRGTHAPEITQIVWERRGQDKVGPLIRWAGATIAADPVLRSASRAEQVACFARLMPDTTIGRHAVQHIGRALEGHERRAQYNASRPTAPGPHVAAMEHQLRQVLETGLHATLNAGLRRLADTHEVRPRATPMPRRLLLGSHDVEPQPQRPVGRWRPAGIALAALALTCAGCSHVLQPPSPAGGCPAGSAAFSPPFANYPQVPDACYRKTGEPVTITSAAVAMSYQAATNQQPAVYGLNLTVPAAEAPALAAITTRSFDSRDPVAISTAGKTWDVTVTAGPLSNGQFGMWMQSRSQILQLQRILIPSA